MSLKPQQFLKTTLRNIWVSFSANFPEYAGCVDYRQIKHRKKTFVWTVSSSGKDEENQF